MVICNAHEHCHRLACSHMKPHKKDSQCNNPCYEKGYGNATCSHVNKDLVNKDLVNKDLVNKDLVNKDLVNKDLVNKDKRKSKEIISGSGKYKTLNINGIVTVSELNDDNIYSEHELIHNKYIISLIQKIEYLEDILNKLRKIIKKSRREDYEAQNSNSNDL